MSIGASTLLRPLSVHTSSLMDMVHDGYFAQNTDVLRSLAGELGT